MPGAILANRTVSLMTYKIVWIFLLLLYLKYYFCTMLKRLRANMHARSYIVFIVHAVVVYIHN
jgi:hypothetical protein